MVRIVRLLLPVLMALVLALCGTACQGGRRFHPVRGHVFANGKPAEGVMIILHPLSDDPQPVQPSAVVQADGSFVLTSYLTQDRALREGAPAGKYLVTCTWYPKDLQKYLGREVLPDKLQGKYAVPKTSGLRADVQDGPTELPPFQLEMRQP